MNLVGTSLFIRKDFILYDSCIQTVLGAQLLFVYEWLRRFVRRSEDEVPQVRKLRSDSLVVSRVGQTKLAKLAGYAHRQNITKVLHQLVDLGWIRIVASDTNGVCCYIMGEYIKDGTGGKHEVFYADAFVQELIDWLLSRHQEEFPGSYRRTGDENVDDSPSYQYGKLSDAPVEWRVQRVSEWLNRKTGCSPTTAPPDTEDPQHSPEHLSSCSPTTSGMQSYDFRGVQSYDCTEEDNSEEDNSEEENQEALAPLAPPLPALEPQETGGETSPVNKIPRDVGKCEDMSESGEYSSVPPPPPSPIPNWLAESSGVAVGSDVVEGSVPRDGPSYSTPVRSGDVQAIIAKASAESKRRLEVQVWKEKTKEAKMAALGGKPIPLSRRKQLKTLEETWSRLLEGKFPGVRLATWEGRERGQVWNLVEKYSGEIIQEALSYLVEQWDEIRTRMLKGRGGVPSVGFLLRFHDVLVVESQLWTEYRRVKKQVDEWYKGDPYKPDPPPELNNRYLKLRKEMADLVLPV